MAAPLVASQLGWLDLVGAILLVSLLITGAIIDWREFRIPDWVTAPLIALGLGLSPWGPGIAAAVIGAFAGYLALFLVELIYRKLRGRDGLGRGDAKLFAAGGAWCGWSGLPMILLLAAGTALIFVFWRGRSAEPVPFGPFLSGAIMMVYSAQAFG